MDGWEVVLVTLNRAFWFLHHDKNSGVPAGKKLELRWANLCLWDMAWVSIFWLNHVEFGGKQDNLAKLFWAKNSFFHGPFCPLLNISWSSRPHRGIFRSFSACSANKKSDRTFTQIRINVEKSWIKLSCMVEYFFLISHCILRYFDDSLIIFHATCAFVNIFAVFQFSLQRKENRTKVSH